jgi:hypothetical protein
VYKYKKDVDASMASVTSLCCSIIFTTLDQASLLEDGGDKAPIIIRMMMTTTTLLPLPIAFSDVLWLDHFEAIKL